MADGKRVKRTDMEYALDQKVRGPIAVPGIMASKFREYTRGPGKKMKFSEFALLLSTVKRRYHRKARS